MKYLKKFFILLLCTFSFILPTQVFWQDLNNNLINNIPVGNQPWWNTWWNNSSSTNTSWTVNRWNTSTKAWVTFCDASGQDWRIKPMTLSREENAYAAMTYLNTLSDTRGTENEDDYEIGFSQEPWTKFYGRYQALHQECIKKRLETLHEWDKIAWLYHQVKFVNQYYNSYPKKLRTGLMPPLMLVTVDFIDEAINWWLAITILNIIIWTTLYIIWPDDKKWDFFARTMKWFWYFLIFALLKLGVVGSVILLFWMEFIDFVAVILPF